MLDYDIAQVLTTTDGADTTLVEVSPGHRYVGTIRACFSNTANSDTTEYSINATTSGASTTEGFQVKDVNLSHKDPPEDYTIVLPENYKLYVKSTTGEMSFSFFYQNESES